ncbi:hypothetical protein KM1_200690 [Entamoeba histolytica HM-3:IMSS]|uniref:TLDc domain-containing protein n=5 Tax=Entamoeba histolytica TaxID=5759 RepID=C4LXN7_ENTH1|nr:hypothetical protein EHI_013950 [Entamoeba histolytica HM-1:IMSS]EMD44198.1 Hypothetical protein EHI5A_158030 [Entamoeba histolytica KU27]EMS11369.1 hypothetical protein KM1_200690 [Entamoeba histolytica HM-3:IMSS]ENY61314.1 hypothetical protein EHI7A_119080 [Entamoeba histolytica HM-1:IMSS-A]GAT93526.1 hypothetical protein CL6EHI_013950 [Entamoeba histolytica]EAL45106.1 hypothetical protein EHI_013950 [Entamoeba histolytica HM-1:IMSS]|eukprot:XP_650492.1 hypothetical protein EHI_013950 [Entamoeba histolytica HM-1:IMSS]
MGILFSKKTKEHKETEEEKEERIKKEEHCGIGKLFKEKELMECIETMKKTLEEWSGYSKPTIIFDSDEMEYKELGDKVKGRSHLYFINISNDGTVFGYYCNECIKKIDQTIIFQTNTNFIFRLVNPKDVNDSPRRWYFDLRPEHEDYVDCIKIYENDEHTVYEVNFCGFKIAKKGTNLSYYDHIEECHSPKGIDNDRINYYKDEWTKSNEHFDTERVIVVEMQ